MVPIIIYSKGFIGGLPLRTGSKTFIALLLLVHCYTFHSLPLKVIVHTAVLDISLLFNGFPSPLPSVTENYMVDGSIETGYL